MPCGAIFDAPAKLRQLSKLEEEIAEPDFWSNPEKSQKAMRGRKRIEEAIGSGKLKVIFNSAPVEFKEDSAILDVQGELREIANDFVWVFAGGTPPNDFLKKIGVEFGMKDLTLEAGKEARMARTAAKELAHT